MAEKFKDIDDLFREKLERHSVNPSPMAWEKLQGRLAQKKTPWAPWIKIAASLVLLLGLTALLWLNVGQTNEEPEAVADKEPTPAVIQEEPAGEATPPFEETVDEKEPPVQKATVNNADHIPAKPNLAVATSAEPAPLREVLPLEEIEEIELPPLDAELWIAETMVAEPDIIPNEVTYKVTIISNGIKNTPKKETLVGELENKIDKIGGFIDKVDQGFADLQDAKNNLFASIITKK